MFKKKMPAEHCLILYCTRIKADAQTQKRIHTLLNHQIDWHKVTSLSKEQETTPFVYAILNKLNLLNIIPEDSLSVIKNYYYSNLKRNLVIETEIIGLLKLFYQKEIKVIPLKGFELIQNLYRSPALRIMVDIDILIKPSDFNESKEILRACGFKTESKNETIDSENIILFSKEMLPNHNLFIEIHCALVSPRPYEIKFPRLWERTKEITLGGQKMLCLSAEDTFLSLAIHIRRHTRRLTLKFIVDIAELLKAKNVNLDWQYILDNAKRNHITTSVYFAIYLAQELLDAPCPDNVVKTFSPNIIKKLLIKLSINKTNFFDLEKNRGILLRILLFDNFADFMFYLWKIAFIRRFLRKNLNK